MLWRTSAFGQQLPVATVSDFPARQAAKLARTAEFGQQRTYTETISPDKLLRMNRYIDELGEPHLHLAGLKLWVHRYQYRDAGDYWDGNWLHATAICSENGATVLV